MAPRRAGTAVALVALLLLLLLQSTRVATATLPSPLLWWTLNNVTSSVADASGNAFNGTVNNGPLLPTYGTDGSSTSAAYFSSTLQSIEQTGIASRLNGLTAFGICLWFRMTTQMEISQGGLFTSAKPGATTSTVGAQIIPMAYSTGGSVTISSLSVTSGTASDFSFATLNGGTFNWNQNVYVCTESCGWFSCSPNYGTAMYYQSSGGTSTMTWQFDASGYTNIQVSFRYWDNGGLNGNSDYYFRVIYGWGEAADPDNQLFNTYSSINCNPTQITTPSLDYNPSLLTIQFVFNLNSGTIIYIESLSVFGDTVTQTASTGIEARASLSSFSEVTVSFYNATLEDKCWHQYCMTWSSGDAVSLYLDGSLATTSSSSYAFSSVTAVQAFLVGVGVTDCSSGTLCAGSTGFMGAIEDVRIYNVSLAAGDVHTLYAAAAPASKYACVSCGNGICEPGFESSSTCPADCVTLTGIVPNVISTNQRPTLTAVDPSGSATNAARTMAFTTSSSTCDSFSAFVYGVSGELSASLSAGTYYVCYTVDGFTYVLQSGVTLTVIAEYISSFSPMAMSLGSNPTFSFSGLSAATGYAVGFNPTSSGDGCGNITAAVSWAPGGSAQLSTGLTLGLYYLCLTTDSGSTWAEQEQSLQLSVISGITAISPATISTGDQPSITFTGAQAGAHSTGGFVLLSSTCAASMSATVPLGNVGVGSLSASLSEGTYRVCYSEDGTNFVEQTGLRFYVFSVVTSISPYAVMNNSQPTLTFGGITVGINKLLQLVPVGNNCTDGVVGTAMGIEGSTTVQLSAPITVGTYAVCYSENDGASWVQQASSIRLHVWNHVTAVTPAMLPANTSSTLVFTGASMLAAPTIGFDASNCSSPSTTITLSAGSGTVTATDFPALGTFVVCYSEDGTHFTDTDLAIEVWSTITALSPDTMETDNLATFTFVGLVPGPQTSVAFAANNDCTNGRRVQMDTPTTNVATLPYTLAASTYAICLTQNGGTNWILEGGAKLTVVASIAQPQLWWRFTSTVMPIQDLSGNGHNGTVEPPTAAVLLTTGVPTGHSYMFNMPSPLQVQLESSANSWISGTFDAVSVSVWYRPTTEGIWSSRGIFTTSVPGAYANIIGARFIKPETTAASAMLTDPWSGTRQFTPSSITGSYQGIYLSSSGDCYSSYSCLRTCPSETTYIFYDFDVSSYLTFSFSSFIWYTAGGSYYWGGGDWVSLNYRFDNAASWTGVVTYYGNSLPSDPMTLSTPTLDTGSNSVLHIMITQNAGSYCWLNLRNQLSYTYTKLLTFASLSVMMPAGNTQVEVVPAGDFQTLCWQHLVITYSSTTRVNTYINGILQNNDSVHTPPPGSYSGAVQGLNSILVGVGAADCTIGNGCEGSTGWAGTIDDFRFYNYELTSTQAQLIFLETQPAVMCPLCGNGECTPGFENATTCPADCVYITGFEPQYISTGTQPAFNFTGLTSPSASARIMFAVQNTDCGTAVGYVYLSATATSGTLSTSGIAPGTYDVCYSADGTLFVLQKHFSLLVIGHVSSISPSTISSVPSTITFSGITGGANKQVGFAPLGASCITGRVFTATLPVSPSAAPSVLVNFGLAPMQYSTCYAEQGFFVDQGMTLTVIAAITGINPNVIPADTVVTVQFIGARAGPNHYAGLFTSTNCVQPVTLFDLSAGTSAPMQYAQPRGQYYVCYTEDDVTWVLQSGIIMYVYASITTVSPSIIAESTRPVMNFTGAYPSETTAVGFSPVAYTGCTVLQAQTSLASSTAAALSATLDAGLYRVCYTENGVNWLAESSTVEVVARIPAPILHWAFDSTSGMINDLSGNGHNGSVTAGAYPHLTTGVDGGDCFFFNSTGQQVQLVGNTTFLQSLSSVTVSFWYRAAASTLGTARGLFTTLQPGLPGYTMGARLVAPTVEGTAADVQLYMYNWDTYPSGVTVTVNSGSFSTGGGSFEGGNDQYSCNSYMSTSTETFAFSLQDMLNVYVTLDVWSYLYYSWYSNNAWFSLVAWTDTATTPVTLGTLSGSECYQSPCTLGSSAIKFNGNTLYVQINNFNDYSAYCYTWDNLLVTGEKLIPIKPAGIDVKMPVALSYEAGVNVQVDAVPASPPSQSDCWQYIALTYSGTSGILSTYVFSPQSSSTNGGNAQNYLSISPPLGSFSGPVAPLATLIVGEGDADCSNGATTCANTKGWGGAIDEFQMFGTALTQAQINYIYTLQSPSEPCVVCGDDVCVYGFETVTSCPEDCVRFQSFSPMAITAGTRPTFTFVNPVGLNPLSVAGFALVSCNSLSATVPLSTGVLSASLAVGTYVVCYSINGSVWVDQTGLSLVVVRQVTAVVPSAIAINNLSPMITLVGAVTAANSSWALGLGGCASSQLVATGAMTTSTTAPLTELLDYGAYHVCYRDLGSPYAETSLLFYVWNELVSITPSVMSADQHPAITFLGAAAAYSEIAFTASGCSSSGQFAAVLNTTANITQTLLQNVSMGTYNVCTTQNGMDWAFQPAVTFTVFASITGVIPLAMVNGTSPLIGFTGARPGPLTVGGFTRSSSNCSSLVARVDLTAEAYGALSAPLYDGTYYVCYTEDNSTWILQTASSSLVVREGLHGTALLYWTMTPDSSGVVSDLSGNGHTGLLVQPEPLINTPGVRIGRDALYFNSSLQEVQLSGSASFLSNLAGITVAMWYRAAASTIGTDRGLFTTSTPGTSDSVLGARYSEYITTTGSQETVATWGAGYTSPAAPYGFQSARSNNYNNWNPVGSGVGWSPGNANGYGNGYSSTWYFTFDISSFANVYISVSLYTVRENWDSNDYAAIYTQIDSGSNIEQATYSLDSGQSYLDLTSGTLGTGNVLQVQVSSYLTYHSLSMQYILVYGDQLILTQPSSLMVTLPLTATTVTQILDSGVPTTCWQHLAVTYANGGNMVVYINGVQQSSVFSSSPNAGDYTGTLSGISTFLVGVGERDCTSGTLCKSATGFAGAIDNVRIFNSSLSAGDVALLYWTDAPVTGLCPYCGDGVCQTGFESVTTCPTDCLRVSSVAPLWIGANAPTTFTVVYASATASSLVGFTVLNGNCTSDRLATFNYTDLGTSEAYMSTPIASAGLYSVCFSADGTTWALQPNITLTVVAEVTRIDPSAAPVGNATNVTFTGARPGATTYVAFTNQSACSTDGFSLQLHLAATDVALVSGLGAGSYSLCYTEDNVHWILESGNVFYVARALPEAQVYWRLNGSDLPVVRDISGHGRNGIMELSGVLQVNPLSTPGIGGNQALYFSGIGQRVRANFTPSFLDGAAAATVSVWYRAAPAMMGTNRGWFTTQTPGTPGDVIGMRYQKAQYSLSAYSLIYAYESGRTQGYVSGPTCTYSCYSIGTSAGPPMYMTSNSYWTTFDTYFSYDLTGYTSWYVLWDAYVNCANQVTYNLYYNVGAGNVQIYSGTLSCDQSVPSWQQSFVSGSTPTFSGGAVTTLFFTAYLVNTYMYMNSLQIYGQKLTLSLPANVAVQMAPSSMQVQIYSKAPTTTCWQHLAVTYDNATEAVTVYANGQAMSSYAQSSSNYRGSLNRTATLIVGAGEADCVFGTSLCAGTQGLIGAVAEFRVWDTALDAGQVQLLYGSMLPTTGLCPYCGDGVCATGFENASSCVSDCGTRQTFQPTVISAGTQPTLTLLGNVVDAPNTLMGFTKSSTCASITVSFPVLGGDTVTLREPLTVGSWSVCLSPNDGAAWITSPTQLTVIAQITAVSPSVTLSNLHPTLTFAGARPGAGTAVGLTTTTNCSTAAVTLNLTASTSATLAAPLEFGTYSVCYREAATQSWVLQPTTASLTVLVASVRPLTPILAWPLNGFLPNGLLNDTSGHNRTAYVVGNVLNTTVGYAPGTSAIFFPSDGITHIASSQPAGGFLNNLDEVTVSLWYRPTTDTLGTERGLFTTLPPGTSGNILGARFTGIDVALEAQPVYIDTFASSTGTAAFSTTPSIYAQQSTYVAGPNVPGASFMPAGSKFGIVTEDDRVFLQMCYSVDAVWAEWTLNVSEYNQVAVRAKLTEDSPLDSSCYAALQYSTDGVTWNTVWSATGDFSVVTPISSYFTASTLQVRIYWYAGQPNQCMEMDSLEVLGFAQGTSIAALVPSGPTTQVRVEPMPPVQTTCWQHLVVAYSDATQLNVYVNGQPTQSLLEMPAAGLYNGRISGVQTLIVGQSETDCVASTTDLACADQTGWKGAIQDLRVFDMQLSASEALELFLDSAGSANLCPYCGDGVCAAFFETAITCPTDCLRVSSVEPTVMLANAPVTFTFHGLSATGGTVAVGVAFTSNGNCSDTRHTTGTVFPSFVSHQATLYNGLSLGTWVLCFSLNGVTYPEASITVTAIGSITGLQPAAVSSNNSADVTFIGVPAATGTSVALVNAAATDCSHPQVTYSLAESTTVLVDTYLPPGTKYRVCLSEFSSALLLMPPSVVLSVFSHVSAISVTAMRSNTTTNITFTGAHPSSTTFAAFTLTTCSALAVTIALPTSTTGTMPHGLAPGSYVLCYTENGADWAMQPNAVLTVFHDITAVQSNGILVGKPALLNFVGALPSPTTMAALAVNNCSDIRATVDLSSSTNGTMQEALPIGTYVVCYTENSGTLWLLQHGLTVAAIHGPAAMTPVEVQVGMQPIVSFTNLTATAGLVAGFALGGCYRPISYTLPLSTAVSQVALAMNITVYGSYVVCLSADGGVHWADTGLSLVVAPKITALLNTAMGQLTHPVFTFVGALSGPRAAVGFAVSNCSSLSARMSLSTSTTVQLTQDLVSGTYMVCYTLSGADWYAQPSVRLYVFAAITAVVPPASASNVAISVAVAGAVPGPSTKVGFALTSCTNLSAVVTLASGNTSVMSNGLAPGRYFVCYTQYPTLWVNTSLTFLVFGRVSALAPSAISVSETNVAMTFTGANFGPATLVGFTTSPSCAAPVGQVRLATSSVGTFAGGGQLAPGFYGLCYSENNGTTWVLQPGVTLEVMVSLSGIRPSVILAASTPVIDFLGLVPLTNLRAGFATSAANCQSVRLAEVALSASTQGALSSGLFAGTYVTCITQDGVNWVPFTNVLLEVLSVITAVTPRAASTGQTPAVTFSGAKPGATTYVALVTSPANCGVASAQFAKTSLASGAEVALALGTTPPGSYVICYTEDGVTWLAQTQLAFYVFSQVTSIAPPVISAGAVTTFTFGGAAPSANTEVGFSTSIACSGSMAATVLLTASTSGQLSSGLSAGTYYLCYTENGVDFVLQMDNGLTLLVYPVLGAVTPPAVSAGIAPPLAIANAVATPEVPQVYIALTPTHNCSDRGTATLINGTTNTFQLTEPVSLGLHYVCYSQALTDNIAYWLLQPAALVSVIHAITAVSPQALAADTKATLTFTGAVPGPATMVALTPTDCTSAAAVTLSLSSSVTAALPKPLSVGQYAVCLSEDGGLQWAPEQIPQIVVVSGIVGIVPSAIAAGAPATVRFLNVPSNGPGDAVALVASGSTNCAPIVSMIYLNASTNGTGTLSTSVAAGAYPICSTSNGGALWVWQGWTLNAYSVVLSVTPSMVGSNSTVMLAFVGPVPGPNTLVGFSLEPTCASIMLSLVLATSTSITATVNLPRGTYVVCAFDGVSWHASPSLAFNVIGTVSAITPSTVFQSIPAQVTFVGPTPSSLEYVGLSLNTSCSPLVASLPLQTSTSAMLPIGLGVGVYHVCLSEDGGNRWALETPMLTVAQSAPPPTHVSASVYLMINGFAPTQLSTAATSNTIVRFYGSFSTVASQLGQPSLTWSLKISGTGVQLACSINADGSVSCAFPSFSASTQKALQFVTSTGQSPPQYGQSMVMTWIAPAPQLVSAMFTTDYTGISVNFNVPVAATNATCAQIFTAATLALLGGAGQAQCVWSSGSQLLVVPAPSALPSINVGAQLVLATPGVLFAAGQTYSLAAQGSVQVQANPAQLVPVVSIVGSTTVSVCDDYTFLFVVPSGSGGRPLQSVVWTVEKNYGRGNAAVVQNAITSSPSAATPGAAIVVPSADMVPSTQYQITVQVTNFLGAQSSATLAVTKSSAPVPNVVTAGAMSIFRWQLAVLFATASLPQCATVLADSQMLYYWSVSDASVLLDATRFTPRLSVQPFTLSANTSYLFTATAFLRDNPQAYGSSTTLVSVGISPLQASITAPSSIGSAQPLTLTGVCTDPDQLPGVCTYTWSCTLANGADCVFPYGLTFSQEVNVHAPTITFAAGVLLADVYVFQLTVSKAPSRSLSVSATINVAIGTVPLVNIARVYNVENGILNAGSPFGALAYVENPSIAPSITLQWSSVANPGMSTVNMQDPSVVCTVGGAVSLPSLCINANAFTIGASYTFQLTATASTGAIGYGLISFTVNGPPIGGTMTVAPASGQPGTTSFRISTQNWQGLHQPIRYSFGYIDALTGDFVPSVDEYVSLTTLALTLPLPLNASNLALAPLQAAVRATDAYGASRIITAPVDMSLTLGVDQTPSSFAGGLLSTAAVAYGITSDLTAYTTTVDDALSVVQPQQPTCTSNNVAILNLAVEALYTRVLPASVSIGQFGRIFGVLGEASLAGSQCLNATTKDDMVAILAGILPTGLNTALMTVPAQPPMSPRLLTALGRIMCAIDATVYVTVKATGSNAAGSNATGPVPTSFTVTMVPDPLDVNANTRMARARGLLQQISLALVAATMPDVAPQTFTCGTGASSSSGVVLSTSLLQTGSAAGSRRRRSGSGGAPSLAELSFTGACVNNVCGRFVADAGSLQTLLGTTCTGAGCVIQSAWSSSVNNPFPIGLSGFFVSPFVQLSLTASVGTATILAPTNVTTTDPMLLYLPLGGSAQSLLPSGSLNTSSALVCLRYSMTAQQWFIVSSAMLNGTGNPYAICSIYELGAYVVALQQGLVGATTGSGRGGGSPHTPPTENQTSTGTSALVIALSVTLAILVVLVLVFIGVIYLSRRRASRSRKLESVYTSLGMAMVPQSDMELHMMQPGATQMQDDQDFMPIPDDDPVTFDAIRRDVELGHRVSSADIEAAMGEQVDPLESVDTGVSFVNPVYLRLSQSQTEDATDNPIFTEP